MFGTVSCEFQLIVYPSGVSSKLGPTCHIGWASEFLPGIFSFGAAIRARHAGVLEGLPQHERGAEGGVHRVHR